MFYVYIQRTSPTRGQLKPILFDNADTIEGANALIKKLTTSNWVSSEQTKRTAVFIGEVCTKCKAVFNPVSGSLGYCLACNKAMAEQDREDPSGGAYGEHQWT